MLGERTEDPGLEVDHEVGQETDRETLEAKKERLGPIFQSSVEVWNNSEADLWKGALIVIQLFGDGSVHEISGLVAISVEDSDVELCLLEEDGQPGNSAWMKWDSIIDVRKDQTKIQEEE